MCCRLTGSRCLQRWGRKQKKSAAEIFSVPPPPITPGDMKPIILMGSGSIHLNTGLHMMTMMILRVTCHQLESFLPAGFQRIPREKSFFFQKPHLQKGSACISIWFNLTATELFIEPDLPTCVSVHPHIYFSSSMSPNPVISLIITSIIAPI